MKPSTADIRWIEEIYSLPDPRARPSDACPDLDRLRSAAAAELPPEERREILDHTVGCAYCTESWRLAIQLGARPKIPLWTHFFAILWRDLRLLIELPGLLWGHLESRLAHIGGWRLVPAAVLAAVVALAMLVPKSQRSPHGDGIERGGGAKATVEPLVSEDDVLPRDHAVLRWSGPAEVAYDIRVTTAEGRDLDSVQALAATEYQVPKEKLSGLEPATVLYWYVSVHSTKGGPADVPAFRVRVQ